MKFHSHILCLLQPLPQYESRYASLMMKPGILLNEISLRKRLRFPQTRCSETLRTQSRASNIHVIPSLNGIPLPNQYHAHCPRFHIHFFVRPLNHLGIAFFNPASSLPLLFPPEFSFCFPFPSSPFPSSSTLGISGTVISCAL